MTDGSCRNVAHLLLGSLLLVSQNEIHLRVEISLFLRSLKIPVNWIRKRGRQTKATARTGKLCFAEGSA